MFFFKLLPLILAFKMRVVSVCSVINKTNMHSRSWCDITLRWGSEIQHSMYYSVLPVIFLSPLSYLPTFMDLFELIWPFQKCLTSRGDLKQQVLTSLEKNQTSQTGLKNNNACALSVSFPAHWTCLVQSDTPHPLCRHTPPVKQETWLSWQTALWGRLLRICTTCR